MAILLALQAGASLEADSATIIIQEKPPHGISHLGSLVIGQVVDFLFDQLDNGEGYRLDIVVIRARQHEYVQAAVARLAIASSSP